MGTYWYVNDTKSDEGTTPVFEDEYVSAILSIAKKKGIQITDEMILKEVKENHETRKRADFFESSIDTV